VSCVTTSVFDTQDKSHLRRPAVTGSLRIKCQVPKLNAKGLARLSANLEKEIGFKSLQENIDTTTSGGKLVFHIFGALDEFEREIIRERTQAGLHAARSRGKVGGRPKALSAKELQMLRNTAADKSLAVSDICKTLGIGRTTFYRYVKAGERE
jgi:DNA invertase Pin-like site-specific DNA recombinase